MTSHKRTGHQKARSKAYKGQYATDASHYISANERARYNLPNSNDSPQNYGNQNKSTNRSVHTTIDNHLLGQSARHSFDGGSLRCKYGPIPNSEVKARVTKKIEVAKKTGDIRNVQYRSFLKKGADAYGVDKRKFNGYKN